MYIWFRYDPGDAPAVRDCLNQWAAQGWALAEEQDCTCYFARMERTGRGELTYDVEPASPFRSAEELEHQVRLREAEGWTSVATLNGMDIYRSAPLRFPDPHPPKTNRRTLLQRWLPALIGMLAAVLFSLWLLFGREGAWYLSNAAIYLRFTGVPALVGGLCWLFRPLSLLLGKPMERDSRKGMVFRSILGTLGSVWLFGLCISVALDWLKWPMVLLVALVWLVATVCSSSLWRRKNDSLFRQLTVLFAGIAILSVAALTLVYPAQEQNNLLQSGERSHYSAAQLVQLEDLTDQPGEFLSGSWSKTGSLLVEKTTYEEWWMLDSQRVKVRTTRYRCHLGAERWVCADVTSNTSAQAGSTLVNVETTLDIPAEVLTALAEDAARH